MTKHILNDLPQQKVSGSTMKHPLVRTARFLAGLALVLLGLSAYGCGDTGTATQPAELGGLSVSPGALQPPFNPATTSYTATVSSNVSSTTITASPRVAGDTIRIDNQQTTSQTITLDAPGAQKSVNVVVTETGTGGTSKSYSIQVRRETEDTTLSALSVSTGTLSPSTFDKDTPDYTVNDIGNAVTDVTISATKSNPTTVMQLDSVTVLAGTPSGQATVRLGAPGSPTKVSIVVTAPGGGSNTYTVTINRGASDNNFLRSLAVSSGATALSLVPRFNQAATAYTVNVASTVGSVSVTARVDDATARIRVNGQDATSGSARTITLNPAGQDTPLLIEVTAQNNTPPRRYSVNVKRAALGGNNNLSALTIRPGSLDFRADILTYTVNVGSGVPSVAVSATKADRTATMSQDVTAPAGTATGQATISLGGPGSTTPVVINVIAPNGTPKTYRINVVKAALGGNNNLQSLTVPSHTLSPTFSQTRTRTDYDLGVSSSVGSITVNATTQDPGATVRFLVNGAVGTNAINLPPGPSTTEIEIIVRAPNGNDKSYSITVSRAAPSGNANLSALSVTAGTTVVPLSPPFGSHTVNVAPEVINVRVTARLEDTNATLTINGQGTGSGVASAPITLGDQGSNTNIPIVVIAPNGARKDYSITVNRAAPVPTPDKPAAPDLIDADDSCALLLNSDLCFEGNHTDNITNVTRPRFQITAPKEGETPHLFIGRQKDTAAEYNADDKTMKPGRDLDDGKYEISTTMSNAGGESLRSEVLEIEINTSGPGNVN